MLKAINLSIPPFLIFGFESLLKLVDQEWVEWVLIAFALTIAGALIIV